MGKMSKNFVLKQQWTLFYICTKNKIYAVFYRVEIRGIWKDKPQNYGGNFNEKKKSSKGKCDSNFSRYSVSDVYL